MITGPSIDSPRISGSQVLEDEAGAGLIRPLQVGDRETLGSILRRTEMFTEDEIAIAIELMDVVLDKPGQKDYLINVYHEGPACIGYYCIGPTPGTEGTFDLYWIAVDPVAQSKGIGRKLTDHAEQHIRSHRGRLIVAETSSQPRYGNTRRFYLSRGYNQLARIPDYYRVGDDLIVYGKYLN